ncbi:MAG: 50S ribosomal protein L10 [Fimbriimonadaceae bacterium]|nr:50S ribosomal protein L10 [Fimbriimonadaceae bacterium]MCC6351020.1 50S ribosomal protein L10 [Fimbriimonadaceae bacterium]MCL4283943.1 50S ribosomal protein L10 [Fimbriimonadaceae bacterium]QOJ12764.1 MAG: 50S ribosomal protein L10 [Chthonomonadaceae bacterium]WKZ80884.1 MAG: 50S ribosomal protein L10 [Fimbriimonadaceae bacterium]
MPTAEKQRTIEEVGELYSKSAGLLFTDYRGLKVRELQELRSKLKDAGGEIHVVKNTLLRLGVGEVMNELPLEYHSGPTAVAFVFENESACAKVLVDFAKTHKAFEVKGGYISGKSFDAKAVEFLSKLPSREELIAQVVGLVAAPLSQLVGVVEAIYAQPIRTVYAAADKLMEGQPSPAAEPQAEASGPEPDAPAAESETPVRDSPAEPGPASEPAPVAEVEENTPVAEASPNESN